MFPSRVYHRSQICLWISAELWSHKARTWSRIPSFCAWTFPLLDRRGSTEPLWANRWSDYPIYDRLATRPLGMVPGRFIDSGANELAANHIHRKPTTHDYRWIQTDFWPDADWRPRETTRFLQRFSRLFPPATKLRRNRYISSFAAILGRRVARRLEKHYFSFTGRRSF